VDGVHRSGAQIARLLAAAFPDPHTDAASYRLIFFSIGGSTTV